jgi:serine/threonine-protein kinase RsbW
MDYMQPPHTSRVVELKIPSELGYEKIAREAVATVAKRLGFSQERIEDIKLAIAEACTNAISYGSEEDSRTKIVVVLTADEDKLDILVKDPGFGGPPPDEIVPPSIEDMMAGKRKFGGMGLYIIQELMDKAEFIPGTEEDGNQFHMVIYRMSDEQLSDAPNLDNGSTADDNGSDTLEGETPHE